MNALLPTIEQLAEATDDQARARWLLSCPHSILMTYQTTIRNRLDVAGFELGVAYLDCELTSLRAVRRNDGKRRENPLTDDLMSVAYPAASNDPTDIGLP